MKKLISVTFFTALLTLLRMISGFIIAKVIAIYTGPTGLAMIGQIQSLIQSMNGLVSSPVGNGVVRFTAENHLKGYVACSPWWRASVQWSIIIFCTIAPVIILFSGWISEWLFSNNNYTWVVILSLCVLPFSVLGILFNSIINGQQLYSRYIKIGVFSVILSSLTMLVLIFFFGMRGVLFAAVIQNGVIGIVVLFFSFRQPWFKLELFFGKVEALHRKSIGSYALMSISSAISVPISLIFIRNILIAENGWEQAGQWQAVWKISETYLAVITIALSTYYLPRLSSLCKWSEIRTESHKTALIILPIVIVLAFIVYFSRDLIITLLFTDSFAPARDLFFIQLCGDVVKIISWLYAFPMISRGMTKLFISTELIFSALFVLFSFIFVKFYGVQGANIAYLMNYILYFIVVIFLVKPKENEKNL